MRNFLLTLGLCLCVQTVFCQTTYTWKGTVSPDWNTPGNWNPAGIPAPTDNIIIVTAPNFLVLTADADIANLTLTSGRIDMGGFILRVNGTTATLTAGTIQNGFFKVTGANNTSFGNGPVALSCKTDLKGATMMVRNATFSDSTWITKTGATSDLGGGNCIYNGPLIATNTGSGYLCFGNSAADVYNAPATFYNLGTNNLYVANNSSGHIFNAPVVFINKPVGNNSIYIGQYSTSTTFNDNIEVSAVGGNGIFFCSGNSAARASVAANKTITLGAAGFTSGTLMLKQLTMATTTPQSFVLSDSAALNIGPLSSFGGDVVGSAATIYVNQTIFSGTALLTKTGSSNDYSYGGNTFNNTLTLNSAGSGFWVMGENLPDTYNAASSFNNLGSAHLYISHNNTGSTFNGVATFNNTTVNNQIYISSRAAATTFNNNIVFNCSSTGGISMGTTDSVGYVTQSPGYTLSIGSAGFTAGTLLFRKFTQYGAGANTLTLTDNAKFTVGYNSSFDADMTITSPSIYLHGAIFNGATNITKTGGSGDYSDGGNTFNGTSVFTNAGSSYFLLGNKNPDIWNSDVTFTNKGTERILPCWGSAGNQFNGNIYINNVDSASGIQFCGGNSSATAILAAGKTILAGVNGLSVGYLYLKQFTQLGTVPVNLTGDANTSIYLGPYSEFNGAVSVTAPNVYVQGATYNAAATFTKTAGRDNTNNGYLNIFNSTCTINQQSSTGYIQLGNNSNDQFNDDIIVTSTGTNGIYLGRSNGTGVSTLAAGKTIRVGAAGFSGGFLYFKTFRNLSTVPMNLNFTGTTTFLAFSDSADFAGNINSVTPGLYFNGAFFRGKVNAIKTGTKDETSSGNNAFYDSVSINNAGTGNIIMANSLPDTFYMPVHFASTGTSIMAVAWNSFNSMYYGDITVSSTDSSRGVSFCGNTNSSATLAAGKTIKIGSAGFSGGALYFRRFTQLGSAPISLTMTGTSSLYFSNGSLFGGNITSSSPALLLNGCTFNGILDLTKTGPSGDWGSGGNIFNGVSKFTNTGTSYLLFGSTNPDIWNNDVTFTNNGTERVLPCWASTGNQFNGNIYVNSSGTGQGIRFCGGNSTATATLAAGKTIQNGTDGFNAGNLVLKQFTQLGTAPVNITMSSTAKEIQYGPLSSFGGNVTSSTPGLYFNGCTFNGTTNCTKTGSSSDFSNGGNIFVGNAVMTNAGSNYLVFANSSPDLFQANATFNNTGSSNLYVAHNSSGNVLTGLVTFNNTPTANSGIYVSQNSPATQFNNIVVTSTNGQGILFCNNSTGSVVLNAGYTISVGAGGFSAGNLGLRQFTQAGTTAQTLNLSGTANLIFGPTSVFNGPITTVSPGLAFNGVTFNGAVNATKNGTVNDQSQGNNIFNSSFALTVTGTGYEALANNYTDAYNGNVSFTQTGTGKLYPNFNANCTYGGGIMVNSTSPTVITFGSNNGTATLNGTGVQNMDAATGAPAPIFTRLVIANTGGGVTCNTTSINVSKTLTMTSGLLNTNTTYMLTMQTGSTTTAGNALSTSYVNGPMRYQKASSGSTILQFPIGSGADCRPIILTVNHTNSTQYTYQAQLFNASATDLRYTLPPSVDMVSGHHYYTINRMNSAFTNTPTQDLSGNQKIEMFFGLNDDVGNGAQLTIVKNAYNAPTYWFNIGGAGGPAYSGGARLIGSITSTSSPSVFNSFSTFALANVSGGMNILPTELLYFTARPNKSVADLAWVTATESGNSHFTVERSMDAVHYESLQRVNSKAVNGNSTIALNYTSTDKSPLTGTSYYRLKQTDLNGRVSYSHVQAVNFNQQQRMAVYPNPSNGTVYITGLGNNEKTALIEWFDVSGKLMLKQTVSVQGGLARIETNLPDGVYILKSTSGNSKTTQVQNVIIRK